MRERELLRLFVDAMAKGGVTLPFELRAIMDDARAELARPVPSVDEAWAEVEDEMHWFRLDEPGAQGAGLKATIRSYAQAVAAAAVERHRAVLASALDKCSCMCPHVAKAKALLADAQKAG